MDELKEKVDSWISTGADGIFLDCFGYDFQVSRSRQNEIVNYIHLCGLPAVANAWLPEDVFGSDMHTTYNPGGIAPVINAEDYYCMESFQINNGEYQTKACN